MENDQITSKIIGAAIEVHKELGPGLLESAYEKCLLYEIRNQGLKVESQILLPVKFKDVEIDAGYRMDLLVEDKIVVEIKAVDYMADIYLAQILTYMKLGGYHLGLLINFNVTKLVDGVKRVING